MCAITGFIDFNKQSNLKILKDMTDILYHRGPNDSGYELFDSPYASIGLGHRRLSILDLSKKGHQPMHFKHLTIVYNGEIYNFKEIKKELQQEGYRFISNSDTEVILKSFDKWGIEKSIEKFIGMFAFVIYDKKNQKIFCVRDRTGVKPFYYYFDQNLFLFSSELKSFHKHPKFKKEISTEGLASYFKYDYILAPYTIFKNSFKLPSAHYLELDLKNKTFKIEKYWDHLDFYNKPKLDISEKEAIEKSEELMESAFQYRMVSDVDVGVFLSGGYDSTCVTAILQKNSPKKIKTFTIGFYEKDYNEAKFAKEYAKILGTDHHELYITQKDILNLIEKIPFIYDEPFSDNSVFPTVLVSKFASEYVKVALSADGGDEIFGGYTKYQDIKAMLKKINIIKNIDNALFKNFIPLLKSDLTKNIILNTKIKNLPNKYNKLIDILESKSDEEIFNRYNSILSDKELSKLIQTDFSLNTNFNTLNKLNNENNFISKAMAIDYSTYMIDDILVKVDRASMSASLEAREPFLDHRIIEFASRLPTSIKCKNNTPKYIIKKIVHKYIPKEKIDRPKKGFSIPMQEWYEDKLNDLFQALLSEQEIKKYGILNPSSVKEIINRYSNGESYLIRVIWRIFIFQLWCRKWL